MSEEEKDFWDLMGLCLSCYWLDVYGMLDEKFPENFECSCYTGMPLEWFRRQRKCKCYTNGE